MRERGMHERGNANTAGKPGRACSLRVSEEKNLTAKVLYELIRMHGRLRSA